MSQGSAGNVIAALCSFFIPGLGQLVQGRLLMAILHFVLAGVLWIVLLGGSSTSGPFWTPPCGKRRSRRLDPGGGRSMMAALPQEDET